MGLHRGSTEFCQLNKQAFFCTDWQNSPEEFRELILGIMALSEFLLVRNTSTLSPETLQNTWWEAL